MLGRRRIRLLVAAVATTLVMGGAGTAWQVQAGFNAAPAAGPASTAQWSGTIVLRNDGQAAATVVLNFYNTAGTLVKSYNVPGSVPAKGTVQVDTEGIPELPSGFLGSAVVSANQPVSATWLGYDVTNPAVNRTLYNGFTEGASLVYVPSISNGYNDQTSTLAVQNSENSPTNITIRFFERFTGAQTAAVTDTLTPNTAHYYDVGALPGGQSLPAPWTGDALVESGTSKVVAAVHQPRLTGTGASMFEGVSVAGTSAYFPSVAYQAGDRRMTTFISVQNATTASTTVDVVFYNANGTTAGSARGTLGGYQKQSFSAAAGGVPAGWAGTAVVKASSAVAAVANTNGVELSSAYAGPSTASLRGSLPFVRWAAATDAKGLRTSIEVMNTDASGPADITVRFYDQNGTLLQAPAFRGVPPYGKATTDPGTFIGDGTFQGTVEVEGTRPVVATVIAAAVDGSMTEAYTSQPIP